MVREPFWGLLALTTVNSFQRNLLLSASIGCAIVLFLLLVWPTPWETWNDVQSTKRGNTVIIPMRRSRFDGHVESNIGDSWEQGQAIID